MNYIITKNPAHFEKIGQFNFCSIEKLKDLPKKIAFDSETTGLEARYHDMFCCQIGTGKDNFIVDMYVGKDCYTFEDVIPYIEGKILVGHNITFDLSFMYKHNFWPKEVRDTMIASKIIHNGKREYLGTHMVPWRHDFGTVMERELNLVYDKDEQKTIHIVKLSRKSTIEYSFNDVDRLLELEAFMYDKIEKRGYKPTYILNCQFTRALAYIESCGLPISRERWLIKMEADNYNQRLWSDFITEFIFDHLPEFRINQYDLFEERKDINVSLTSTKQMINVFKAFKIPIIDKDGKESIAEDVISKSKHEFVKLWLCFQEVNHRVTTFGKSIYDKIQPDSRIYTNFNPAVETARLATRKGDINFLNFPADDMTRGCFVPTEGHDLIVCDWEGQENVISADLSGDEAMTASVVDGACLHCAFARMLFPEIAHCSDKEIKTKHKDKRKAAKSPRFAFNYGGNAFTIHTNEGIPLAEAKKIEEAFKELHKGVFAWGDIELDKALKTGYIESVDGWKLHLEFFDSYKSHQRFVNNITKDEWITYRIGKEEYNKWKEDETYVIEHPHCVEFFNEKKIIVSKYYKQRGGYYRQALNNPVQTRGAHMLKRAVLNLFNWIVDSGYQWQIRIANIVHDEIVVEATHERAEEARQMVEHFMIEAGNHYLTNLKIKASANIGQSWAEAK